MKKQTMITLALALTLAMPTMPAFAQKAMSKKEIAEKEKAFKNLQHPWKGKKVAYFGDSITDPNIKASNRRLHHRSEHQGFQSEILGIPAGLARHHPIRLWCKRQTVERHSQPGR